MHILQHIKSFIKFLLSCEIKDTNIIHKALYELLVESLSNNDKIITPINFIKNISKKDSIWASNQQQDPSEFLYFLITELNKELCNVYQYEPKIININPIENNISSVLQNIITSKYCNDEYLNEYSILKNIFYGVIQSYIYCDYCKNNKFSPELYLIIKLPISNKNNNIYDCLNNYFNNNELFDTVQCSFCGLKNKNIFNTIYLWKTPEILIFEFLRFSNNLSKIYTSILYPIENLNLYKYFDKNSPYKNNCIYDLIGINIHLGLNINSGHYISIIKNLFNNNWYIYNDEHSLEQINDLNKLQNNNTFILFYLLRE